jgi:peptidoglycan/xylan/chitin deacetylase (PgdA/CDA1 family)
MRGALTKQVKDTLLRSGAHGWLRRLFPSAYPFIVRYHSVSYANHLISDGITVSPEDFERQVKYFAQHFRPMTMNAIIQHLEQGIAFPENAIVFTFDDGYADNYDAAKILRKYGMAGVFYITAGCIESNESFWVAEIHHLVRKTHRQAIRLRVGDRPMEMALSEESRPDAIRRLTRLLKGVNVATRDAARAELRKQLDDVPALDSRLMLSWGQLAEMVSMGMEIGGHTMTHCNLPNAANEEAWNEVSRCKALLEKMLKIEVRHFAYPNGGSSEYYNGRIKDMVRRAGYRSAVTSKAGAVVPGGDPFELRRMRTTERLSDIVWEIEENRIRATSADLGSSS